MSPLVFKEGMLTSARYAQYIVQVILEQEDNVLFQQDRPTHMMPVLLNTICRMFNNFPSWHDWKTCHSFDMYETSTLI